MARFDLTDAEWAIIAPLLPNKPRGVPRVEDRRVLNGIFYPRRSAGGNADGRGATRSAVRRTKEMIPKDCKRLAKIGFPIAEVSRWSLEDKRVRNGHPSSIHGWWARRPLASSRAMLLGLLWPDPCDALCPSAFKAEARKLLRQVAGCNPGTTDDDLRNALFKFIADFANWDLASNRNYLDVARKVVNLDHNEDPPLIVDPFAGGGSIPLEALRIGCEANASDLNPVAFMILRMVLDNDARA